MTEIQQTPEPRDRELTLNDLADKIDELAKEVTDYSAVKRRSLL